MKKKKVTSAILIVTGMITGCFGGFGKDIQNAESSRIYIAESGELKTATVETYVSQDYYNVDELKGYLEETATLYNKTNGEDSVKLEFCSMQEGIARMVFQYDSEEDLVDFVSLYEDKDNQVDSLSLTICSDVWDQIEAVELFKASDRKKAEEKSLKNKGESHVLIVEAKKPVTIQTENRLLFVSRDVVVIDQHTVQTPEGKSYIIFK